VLVDLDAFTVGAAVAAMVERVYGIAAGQEVSTTLA